jgi:uncharacterized membrane protein
MKKKALFLYSFTLVGIVIWLGLIFLAPYLKSRSLESNIFLYALFSPLCHQIPSRSFFIFNYPLAVCARCLGIYFGFFAGAGLFPFVRRFSNLTLPKTQTFVFFTFPVALDFIGNLLRLWRSSNGLRFSTGFIWGAVLPFYFIPGMADFLSRLKRKKASSGATMRSKLSLKS